MKKTIFGALLLLSCFAHAQQTFSKILKMDSHTHVDVPMEKGVKPAQQANLANAMRKAGMDVVGMTFAVDYVTLKYKGHAWERFLKALDEQDIILKNSGMERALNARQLKKAWKRSQPIAIQCVEGGHFLEGDLSRLQEAYKRGLRVFCLLHDNDAEPPLGDIYTNEPKYGGLTSLGADAIRESERLGILVDLAHCDSTTVAQALQVATKPLIITHTGLNTRLGDNEFMANLMYKRLISPAVAKMVANKGGVIGVWPHLASSAKEYAQNIKAMVDIVGIDHVCIGTDSKITPEIREIDPEKMKEFQKRQEEERQKNPNGNETKPAPKGMFDKDPNAINHVFNAEPDNFYHSVIRCLQEIGFSNKDIKKICGENFLRVFDIATKK